jgi:hypothetical protein
LFGEITLDIDIDIGIGIKLLSEMEGICLILTFQHLMQTASLIQCIVEHFCLSVLSLLNPFALCYHCHALFFFRVASFDKFVRLGHFFLQRSTLLLLSVSGPCSRSSSCFAFSKAFRRSSGSDFDEYHFSQERNQ